jgi:hypothetical protein
MSVELTYMSYVTAAEIIEGNDDLLDSSSSKRKLTYTGLDTSKTLNAASTPPATKQAYFVKALATGAATIDLTALVGSNGAAVDLTGLKVQCLKLKNPATNANTIKAKFGTANPYNLAGADWAITLSPGQEFTFYGDDDTPDVAAGAKNIDLSGTLVQELEVGIVAG